MEVDKLLKELESLSLGSLIRELIERPFSTKCIDTEPTQSH